MWESEVRKIFKNHGYLLNDVAEVNYTKGKKVNGLSDPSSYFCDNMIFWMLCNDTNNKGSGRYGTSTGFAIGTIREILSRYMEKPNIKYIGRGKDKKLDPERREVHKRRQKSLRMGDGVMYIPGYVSVKVSLSEFPLSDVHRIVRSAEKELDDHYVVLHDIDIATDCRGITNRTIVQEYLLENNISIQAIVNDRAKVGDDCISWMEEGKRNKVYNKFIQMLQSSDVRKTVGSIISDLVYNHDPEFTKKLVDFTDHGMSRVESTFYSSKIRSINFYVNEMDDLFKFLDNCPVYHVSFEKQWKRLVRHLDSSFAIYISNKKIFAYSHWWNSITGKIQGYSKSKVSKKEVRKLLANYSFNDRPMYFVKGDLKRGVFVPSHEKTYHREEGCISMTLVPGSNRSLYPSFERLGREALSFEDVGLIEYKNITLNWPKKRLQRTTKALAKISSKNGIPTEEEIKNLSTDDEDEKEPTTIREINISVEGRFQSSHILAMNGPIVYTIVGYGRRMFHRSNVTHVLTSDGTKIRCTKNLQELVEEELVHGIPFQVRLIRSTKIQGYRDAECELV